MTSAFVYLGKLRRDNMGMMNTQSVISTLRLRVLYATFFRWWYSMLDGDIE